MLLSTLRPVPMRKTEKFAKFSSIILDNLVVAAKTLQFWKNLPKEKTWLMYQSWIILQDWVLLDMFRPVPEGFIRSHPWNTKLSVSPLDKKSQSFYKKQENAFCFISNCRKWNWKTKQTKSKSIIKKLKENDSGLRDMQRFVWDTTKTSN